MKIFDGARKELMAVSAVSRDGNDLVIKAKIFGTMPVTAKLSPEEARKGLKLLTPQLVLFLLTFLFRRSAPAAAAKK
jgi:hypothetical protein